MKVLHSAAWIMFPLTEEVLMKSQVNELLHVLRALHKDVQAAYPALKDGLSKDFERIALYCRDRDANVFHLDLPHLESLLLRGLETGRLVLEGALSKRVSNRIQVPRLYSGLWLRIFDKDACLKHEVDVTALAFLRQVLTLGKKIEVECSSRRIAATVGAYHDIERKLRRPDLGWRCDHLWNSSESSEASRPTGLDTYRDFCDQGELYHGNCHHHGGDNCDHRVPPCSSFDEEPGEQLDESSLDPEASDGNIQSMRLHLVQAVDRISSADCSTLPLFGSERTDIGSVERVKQLLEDQKILYKIQRVADFISSSFDVLNPVLYSEHLERDAGGIGFKHGPGAVAERLKNWEKSQFRNWPLKLQGTFPYESCGTTAGSGEERPLNHERASRLICVPKTAKSPRLIAAESTSHQWCQQLILRFLFDQCRKYFGTDFIDFQDQHKSGVLVLKASLNRELATADLSDASDRLSCWTVERIFRCNPSILTALHAARTRYLLDEVSSQTSFVSLAKFASQGTATTFPVMSLVMLCIALGVSLGDNESVTWQTLRKYRNQVRVFGDDIIIPAHGYGQLVRAMELLELKVNKAKSYVNGHFRESCGVDGFQGYDVTPVKPKTLVAGSPVQCQALVDISNNLFLKGYWNASDACFDLLPKRLRRRIRVVGPAARGIRGLASYSGSDERHLDQRWNKLLHRYEVRVWGLLPKTHQRPRNGFSALLDFFASGHSRERSRVVSQFADSRNTRIGVRWEPQNNYTGGDPDSWIRGPVSRLAYSEKNGWCVEQEAGGDDGSYHRNLSCYRT